MTTITQNISDITGLPDNRPWRFSSVLREGPAGSVVTTKTVTVKPVAGVLTVELDPGAAVVSYNNQTYNVTVPEGDSDLWSLIAASVGVPPTTSAQALASAVAAYLTTHSVAVDNSDGTATV